MTALTYTLPVSGTSPNETVTKAAHEAAIQAPLDDLADQIDAHAALTNNPHSVTKSQVGLGNADNTSDLNKPISTATQTALNAKAASTHTHPASDISDSTSAGRAVLTAANAAAQRTALGLGTVATTAAADYATAAQGVTADSAVQPGDNVSVLAETSTAKIMTGTERTKLAAIEAAATANATNAELRDRTTHTGAQAIATVTGLQTALDGKVATADLTAEAAARDVADVVEAWRPGENPDLFSSATTGAPEGRAVLAIGSATANAEGLALRLTGADADPADGYADVAPRAAFAMELDRVYRVRAVVRRNVDPGDPSGHGVELRIRNLNASKSAVSSVALQTSISLTVAMGRTEITALVCRGTPPDGVTVYSPPSTARYGVPFVRVYGNGAETDVELIDWADVTDTETIGVDLVTFADHIADTGNPHSVTKSQVGLANADNTSDLNKPVSTATQTALDTQDAALQTATRTAIAAASNVTRDGIEGYAFDVSDATGKVGMGLTEDSELHVGSMYLAEYDGREGLEYALSFSDLSGQVAAGVMQDGAFMAYQLATSGGTGRDAHPYAFSIHDNDGNVAFAIDPAGEVVFPLGLSTYIPPEDFSTAYPVSNVRDYNGFTVAMRQDRGQSYDVMKLDGGTTAVIQHYAPMLFDPTTGQSNAGWAGDAGGADLETALWPNIALTFSASPMQEGATAVSEASLNDFAPITDNGYQNNSTATVNAFALEHVTRETLVETTPGIIGYTPWYGGQPLSAFIRGTVLFENLMKGCRGALVAAAKYGRTVDCKFMTFVQGESGPLTTYEADLTDYADDVLPEIALQMDLASNPKMILLQTNSEAGDKRVGLAQLAVATAHADVILAAPMYQCPLIDAIHSAPLGRMILADAVALAKRSVLDTGDFTPLQPISATRVGAVIDVVFDVPGTGLAFDTDFVQSATNYGFAYTDSTTSATISTVAIVGADTVRITLNTTPSGSTKKISYAVAASPTVSGWIAERGQLYSPTDVDSAFARLGYAVPEKIRHYSVKFEKDL